MGVVSHEPVGPEGMAGAEGAADVQYAGAVGGQRGFVVRRPKVPVEAPPTDADAYSPLGGQEGEEGLGYPADLRYTYTDTDLQVPEAEAGVGQEAGERRERAWQWQERFELAGLPLPSSLPSSLPSPPPLP